MRKKLLLMGLLLTLCTVGCGKKEYPELPDNPIAFTMGEFEDPEHDQEVFLTIEYNGRTYIPYGTPKNFSFGTKSLDKCIGYIVLDENVTNMPDPDCKSEKVYTVSGDEDNNFLMEYDDTYEWMTPPPIFYRAIDTKGKDITIPKFIDAGGHEFWEEPME